MNHNFNNYNRLKSDKNYIDVTYNETNGGLMATHIEHSFDKNKGYYEKNVQEIGYNNGYAVILEKEDHTQFKIKQTDGTRNGKPFEIGAAETGTINNIRNGLKHCAGKPNTDIAILYFPNKNFNVHNFEKGLSKYNGLINTSQFKKFVEIICISDGKIVYKKSHFKSGRSEEPTIYH
jgi:hypothetical protein